MIFFLLLEEKVAPDIECLPETGHFSLYVVGITEKKW